MSNLKRMGTTILYVTYNGIFDPVGQSQILPYLEEFSKNGYRIRLISFESTKQENRIKEAENRLKNYGIEWLCFQRVDKEIFALKILRFIWAFLRSIFWLQRKPCQILHARGYPGAILGIGLSILQPFRKKIFDMRGFAVEENAEVKGWASHPCFFWIGKQIESILIRSYTDIVTLTEDAKEILRTNGVQKPIHVIPCCVDTDLFRPHTPEEQDKAREKLGLKGKKIMIYAGSLAGWYDLDLFVQTFMTLKKKLPELFLIVLTQNNADKLVNFFKQKSITDYWLLGCDRKHSVFWLALADMGIVSVKSSPAKKASFAIKFAEILSVGVPVLSSSYNEHVRRLITDSGCGVLIEELKKRDSQEKFISYLNDPEVRQRCRQTAMEKLSLLSVGVPAYQKIYGLADNL